MTRQQPPEPHRGYSSQKVADRIAACRQAGWTAKLNLSLSSCDDSDLALLATEGGIAALASLNLYGTLVTDVGLARLSGLTGLAALDLTRTRVSDAGLAHLSGFGALAKLDLRVQR